MSEELNLSYSNLLTWSHTLHEFSLKNRDWFVFKDQAVEAFINSSEKGEKHEDVNDLAQYIPIFESTED